MSELKATAFQYEAVMKQPGHKGKCGLDVLRAGSRRRHFLYLRNCSMFAALAGGMEPKSGTTTNEAEHLTLKRWTRCVYCQHVDRLFFVSRAHTKML